MGLYRLIPKSIAGAALHPYPLPVKDGEWVADGDVSLLSPLLRGEDAGRQVRGGTDLRRSTQIEWDRMDMTTQAIEIRRPVRWHIAVFLAPALLVYTAVMIIPLFGTLQLSLFNAENQKRFFVGLDNFRTLFGDPRWSATFWNALWNNTWFFIIHMVVQNPIGIALAALLSSPKLRFSAFYRTAIFIPTILSFVIVGFAWKLILSPLWGVAPNLLDLVGLKSLFTPWLGKEEYALTTLGLISVWQFVGIPMMLIYAALLSIPTR